MSRGLYFYPLNKKIKKNKKKSLYIPRPPSCLKQILPHLQKGVSSMHPSACRHCYPSPEFASSKPSYQEVYLTGDASGEKLEKTIQEAEVAGYVPGVMGVWVSRSPSIHCVLMTT
jgi:glutaredoxin